MAKNNKKVPEIDEELQIMQSKSLTERVLFNEEKMGLWVRIGRGLIAALALFIAIFAVYTAGFGTLPSWQQRSFHVGTMAIMVYALYPFRKGKLSIPFDLVPLALAIITTAYMFLQYPAIEFRAGAPNQLDLVFGTILLVLVIEGVRRTNGWPMAALATFFLIYIFAGPFFPGLLAHRGFRFVKMIDTMFISTQGIFTEPIYVSSTVLVLFIIFGAFLVKSGIGKFFIDMAYSITGSLPGGPALVAVLSSALLGTVTGNGAANATITGSFTIPLMKRVGYRPNFAAAVEAVASQGGQIMPPIMGAGAFIMAEYTGISYIKIAAMAAVPAIFYFLTAGVVIYLEALKTGLKGVPREELPRFWSVMKNGWYMLIPLIVLIALMMRGYSPMRGGFIAILLSIVLSWVNKSTRMGWLEILESLEKGARNAVGIAMACAAAGIIVGSVILTGLGIRFSRLAIIASGGELIPLMLLVMVASLILGMGMPTVSAYVILAVLAVPALTKLGVTVIAAHLFVFYFGIISGITPPVAITAYTAAGISGGDPTKTGWEATRIGLAGFIVPYMFVFNNALLLQGTLPEIIQGTLTALVGIAAAAAALQGWFLTKLNVFQRIMLLAAAVALIDPGTVTDMVGAVLIGATMLWQVAQRKQAQLQTDLST